MYVAIRSEPGLWTVGHYDPAGKFHPESDHPDSEEAAVRVRYLNGGPDEHQADEHQAEAPLSLDRDQRLMMRTVDRDLPMIAEILRRAAERIGEEEADGQLLGTIADWLDSIHRLGRPD